MKKTLQAKHIPDDAVLSAVRAVLGKNGVAEWASTWDICEQLPDVPIKVLCAKLGSLVRRGLLRGDRFPRHDMRGDFELPDQLPRRAP